MRNYVEILVADLTSEQLDAAISARYSIDGTKAVLSIPAPTPAEFSEETILSKSQALDLVGGSDYTTEGVM